jgi:hypothetical protein
MVAQAIKRYARRRVIGVVRRIVRGTQEAVGARLKHTQGSATAEINTAYIERLQATFRSRLAPLVRKTRAAARQRATLEAGMWLVGTVYNFCRAHRSLRLVGNGAEVVADTHHYWIERTPAQAAGLTDHRWSLHELLSFPVPPTPPKRGVGDVRSGCWRPLMLPDYHPRLNEALPGVCSSLQIPYI